MANWFGSALKAAGEAARSLGKNVGETTSDVVSATGKKAGSLGKNIGKTTAGVASTVGETAGHLSESISEKTTRLVNAVRGWRPFSNEDTLKFLAVLFAVAAADEQLDEAELRMIMASPEAGKLSADEKQTLQSYSYNPPDLQASVRALSEADPELKFGLIFCILNLVRINGKMSPAEEAAIATAQETFEINDVQLDAIRDYIQVLSTIEPEQSQAAIPEVKAAIERMKSVGVPVEALAYPQETVMREMEYSDEKFLAKMKAFGLQAGRGLVEQAYVMWYALHASQTPVTAKLTIAGALAYWILPVDMLPDMLPAVGFTDDFATIAAAMTTVAMSITPAIRAKAKAQTDALFYGEDEFNADAVDLSGGVA